MESTNALSIADASVLRGGGLSESAEAHGVYTVQCFGPDGSLKWEDNIDNVVCTEGKNAMLDGGSIASGSFLGLISSVSYSAVAAGDTAAQINGSNGWKEAGSSTNFPLFSARGTPSWSAASAGAKAFSSAVAMTVVTTGGTVKGCFLIAFSGAVSTIASTAGKLWSAGLFSGGDKVLGVGDTVSVSYSTSL